MSAEGECEDAPAAATVERRLRDEVGDHGLFQWLDVDFEVLEPGRVAMTVPFDEKFANLTSGTMHGGVTATLVDTVSGFALRSTFDDPERTFLTTTDLDVRYVRPVRDDVRAVGEVVRAGGSMGVTDVTVTSETPEGERKTVATGATSYRLFRGEES
ncbi:PaaI family thioesterase [Halomarina ordinaria]|uniref:PaaI family thioesterase n=1 Tax=Halomarina ordinaria TaxID=3033939 RepID=A0ABD5UA31_9EURY|nr:PaaI family thioesterase [Halomarina sp. PSRA2]